eukprot:SAG22_NODE_385_length_11304_cov_21.304775_11_plen_512_part_00
MTTALTIMARLLGLTVGLAFSTAAGPDAAAALGRPHQVWKLSGDPVGPMNEYGVDHAAAGFDCGNGTCLLYVGKSGFMDSAAPLVAHRTSDGGGGPFGGGHCVSRVTCFDQKTGLKAPSPPPTPESVGGAGVKMHELSGSGGLLLVYPNNVEPVVAQQQLLREGGDGGMAWLAHFGAGSTTPDYNLTFPGIALETYSVLDTGIFAVTASTKPDNHGNRDATCAVMLSADSGETVWNNTLTGAHAYFMALKAWRIVGAAGSELLIQVMQSNATAYNLKTGEEVWTSNAFNDFLATDGLTVVGDTVLTLKDLDGNSNVLKAVSVKTGSIAWQYPTAAQLAGMGNLEAFLWDYQCSLPSAPDTTATATAVCWIGFSCQNHGNGGKDADCPAALMPNGSPICGKGEVVCNLALDVGTGTAMYSQPISSGLPNSNGKSGKQHGGLFRLGDIVLLNGNFGTLSAMSVSNGSMLWTVPCSGCADSLLAFESAGPPEGACNAELVELCAAAKAAGVAQW